MGAHGLVIQDDVGAVEPRRFPQGETYRRAAQFRKLPSLFSVVFLLSGCGLELFSIPATNPTREMNITSSSVPFGPKVATLVAVTAGRRLVTTSAQQDSKTHTYMTCAEAPPDAADAFAEASRGNLAATGQAPVQIEAARGFAVSSGQIFTRSQGIQFGRDWAAQLCRDRMNGTVSDADYQRELRQIRAAAERIIIAEMPAIIAMAKKATPTTMIAPTVTLPVEKASAAAAGN